MNYVRSLWILHCRGWCPICPSFPGSDKTATGMLSQWHSWGKPVPQFVCCGVSHLEASEDNGRRGEETVIQLGMKSMFAEWTQKTPEKPKEELFQTRLEICTKNYQFSRQQNNWHDSISTLFHNLLVLLLITFTLLLLLTFLSAPAVSCYFTMLHFHLLPPFPGAKPKLNCTPQATW